MTHCDKFVRRLYTFKGARPQYSPPMNLAFLRQMRGTCPLNYTPTTVAMLAAVTPNKFDNGYYRNLMSGAGLLRSDQELFSGGSQDALVRQYSASPALFRSDFAKAMIKMGNIHPLTGSAGEIRANCHVVNS